MPLYYFNSSTVLSRTYRVNFSIPFNLPLPINMFDMDSLILTSSPITSTANLQRMHFQFLPRI